MTARPPAAGAAPPRRSAGSPAHPALLRVEQFAAPFTRRLLTHGGSTTALLEERVGAPLTLRVVRQTVRSAGSAALRSLLDAEEGRPWIVRRTELLRGGTSVVSRNLVTGPVPHRAEIADLLASATVPLGRGLADRRVPQHRRLLRVGRSPWPPRARSAAWRGYILHLEGEAPLYVEEFFHPAVAPADLRRPAAARTARAVT